MTDLNTKPELDGSYAAWAARQPPVRKRAMHDFIHNSTRLAFARQRMLNGTSVNVDRADESELLGLIQRDRAGVIGPV